MEYLWRFLFRIWVFVYFSGILTIHNGIGEKLGMCLQWLACFVTCYVICFVRGWKLTLVILSSMPIMAALVTGVGRVGIPEASALNCLPETSLRFGNPSQPSSFINETKGPRSLIRNVTYRCSLFRRPLRYNLHPTTDYSYMKEWSLFYQMMFTVCFSDMSPDWPSNDLRFHIQAQK